MHPSHLSSSKIVLHLPLSRYFFGGIALFTCPSVHAASWAIYLKSNFFSAFMGHKIKMKRPIRLITILICLAAQFEAGPVLSESPSKTAIGSASTAASGSLAHSSSTSDLLEKTATGGGKDASGATMGLPTVRSQVLEKLSTTVSSDY